MGINIQPKILNNLSIPSLNYFKIRHFVHVGLVTIKVHYVSSSNVLIFFPPWWD